MDKKRVIRLALAGNPNSGKTTIFNALAGANQRVGNYPGVTVEKKQSNMEYNGYTFYIYDLPGIYSLSAYSLDEVVTRDFIIDEKPDLIVDVLDSTNLERNLYLCLQLQEFGLPVIGALNVIDQAEKRGIRIDEIQLSKLLRIPMIKTIGSKGKGVRQLLDAAIKVIENPEQDIAPSINYGDEVETEIEKIVEILDTNQSGLHKYPSHWLAVKLLEKDQIIYKKLESNSNWDIIKNQLEKSLNWIENHFEENCETIINEQRYGFIHGAVYEVLTMNPLNQDRITSTQKIDQIVLNRYLGIPIFLLIMWAIFHGTFTLGEYPMTWLESLFSFLGNVLSEVIPEGELQSLVVDGILGGVGGMLVFLPNILILFLGISLLEETGYLARTAFLTDRFFHKIGLHGQSFIPLLLGFGCTVPAVMGARTLKNQKDRIVTISVAPLMSCGARLPVYTLLAGAFYTEKNAGNIIFSIYLFGIFLAVCMALIFRKVLFKGESSPFVMELPPYRLPTLRSILWHMWQKASFYLKKAGTIILLASIIIWVLTNYPKPSENNIDNNHTTDKISYEQQHEKIQNQLMVSKLQQSDTNLSVDANVSKKRKQIEYSFAGRLGKFIEPVTEPLGFDWRMNVALISGFVAKEIVVSTLGVLFQVEDDETGGRALRQALKEEKRLNPLIAYIFMLFTLLYIPCLAVLAIIRAELGSWKWVAFVAGYTISLAWLVSFLVYQSGLFLIGL